MHEADEVAPVIPMLDGSNWSLAGKRPDFTQDRLQPDPVFVDCPQRDARLRKGRGHLAQRWAQPSLEVRLGLWVSAYMTGARYPQASAEAAQVGPAQLTNDVVSETISEPGGHSPSAPAVALRMGTSYGRSQLRQL